MNTKSAIGIKGSLWCGIIGPGIKRKAILWTRVIPPEFDPAQHIRPQLILGGECNFIYPSTAGDASIVIFHTFTTEVEAQLVVGLEVGIEANNHGTAVAVSTETDGLMSIMNVKVVKRRAHFQRSQWRRNRDTSIEAGGAKSIDPKSARRYPSKRKIPHLVATNRVDDTCVERGAFHEAGAIRSSQGD